MSRLKLSIVLAFVGIGAASSPIIAFEQTGVVRVNQQAYHAINKPNNGQSMEQVEQTYGSPLETQAAVGEPPITRWKYEQFTVYFEYDRVIHSVQHRS